MKFVILFASIALAVSVTAEEASVDSALAGSIVAVPCKKKTCVRENFIVDPVTCNCVCNTARNCGINPAYGVNPKTCNCECLPQECEVGRRFNRKNCACECLPKTCKGIKWFNEESCACECPMIKCPANYFVDSNCKCVCNTARNCGINPAYGVNPKTCNCECLPQKCENSRWFNKKSCACECLPKTCKGIKWFNEESCSCECPMIKCPANYFVDSNCKCVCNTARNCGFNPAYSVNPKTCECELQSLDQTS